MILILKKYYLQVFSEQCLYEYTKWFEIIIMNVTSKNKSSKKIKKNKIKIYCEKKKKENYEESMDQIIIKIFQKKKKKKKSMKEIVIKFSSNDKKRKTQRICIKITVKN